MADDLSPEQRAERLEQAKNDGLARQRVDRAIARFNAARAARTNPLRAKKPVNNQETL